ncbi:MAG TPA: 50S ribosomal protein L10 [Candidatus Paceibacterota bacterium]|nr:50S ribosomal protein L10 [Candidatus Paceibacterota bacterium]
MAITLQKKKEIIESLNDKLKDAGSAVIVGFKGLKIADITPLRKTLRDGGVSFSVAKKTLFKRAFNDVKIEGNLPPMDGQVALAIGKDPIAPAKSIAEAQKKYKDAVYILGGVLEGKFMSAAEMIALSKIPGREVLLSQLLNVMQSPIQGFVGTLNAVTRDFVCTLDQVAKSKN